MFLLFGLRTRDHMLGTGAMVCDVCGVHAAQQLVKRSTKFTLFFIPLFPVRPARYFRFCANCGVQQAIDPRFADQLVA
ncbi:zinc ribbon domain-containing protein [Couchioplanes caeruleus]|uniref:zinc-ribbon domain-containing protein n=1 Tax=Couchioplanes caeruleus TaxID=56438 RepID=UPI0020BEEDCB|nr:zinc-ribbon domain-containing protein [Couchioplanes caeruleus]UQU62984.1 zinc ribbon domain-containing protein [Couchioplanes caeruleus]